MTRANKIKDGKYAPSLVMCFQQLLFADDPDPSLLKRLEKTARKKYAAPKSFDEETIGSIEPVVKRLVPIVVNAHDERGLLAAKAIATLEAIRTSRLLPKASKDYLALLGDAFSAVGYDYLLEVDLAEKADGSRTLEVKTVTEVPLQFNGAGRLTLPGVPDGDRVYVALEDANETVPKVIWNLDIGDGTSGDFTLNVTDEHLANLYLNLSVNSVPISRTPLSTL